MLNNPVNGKGGFESSPENISKLKYDPAEFEIYIKFEVIIPMIQNSFNKQFGQFWIKIHYTTVNSISIFSVKQ